MFQLFEKIINGRLQPKYISDQNLTEVSRLLKINFDVNPDEEKIITSNEYWNLCIEPYNSYEIINVSDNPDETLITIKETYHDLPALTNPQFQFPPDRKSELYQQLISREYQLITEKIKLQFNDIDNPNEAQFIADKNFNIAIRLSNELNRNNSEFGQMNYKVDLTSSNSFIIHFLNYCLFNIALYIKDIFSPIIEIKKELFWTSGFNCFLEIKIKLEKFDTNVLGFKSKFSPEVVDRIYDIISTDPYSFIEGEKDDFLAVFTPNDTVSLRAPLVWKIKRAGSVNKKSLRSFLNQMTGIKDFTSKEYRAKVNTFFVDEKGNPFNLNKPDTSYSTYHKDFEDIIEKAQK